MHITCEGKAYELFEGATPQNLWNMVSRGRDPETAVLADCEGDIIDFQTPFTGDTDVKWIPLGSPLAHRAYQRSLIMLLAIAAKEVYGGKIEVAVKHALGKALYCEFSDGHVPLQKELDVLRLNFFGSQSREWFFEKYMPEWAFVHHIRIGFTDKKDKDGYTLFDKDGVPKRGSTDSIEYMHAVWHKSNLKPEYTKLVLI